jgi:hypothetical protein
MKYLLYVSIVTLYILTILQEVVLSGGFEVLWCMDVRTLLPAPLCCPNFLLENCAVRDPFQRKFGSKYSIK